MAFPARPARLIGTLVSALAGAAAVFLVRALYAGPTDPGPRPIAAHCGIAAGRALTSTAIRINCGLDKAGVQAVLDSTLAGLNIDQLIGKIRSGQPVDAAQIEALAEKLNVSVESIRPALDALAAEAPAPKKNAASRLAEIIGDRLPVEIQPMPEGGVKPAELVTPASQDVSRTEDTAAAASVTSATAGELTADCAAVAGNKLTADTVDIACGPSSEEITALISRTISAADLAGIVARAARGEAADTAAIDNLAQQLHLTHDNLTVILARLAAANLPDGQVPVQLARLTRARNEMLLIRLASLPRTDPAIQAVRDQAAAALQQGQPDKAERLIAAIGHAPPSGPADIHPVQAQDDVNLLAPDQGGELLAAPSEGWTALLKQGTIDAYPGAEAVFGFADGKQAIFSKFAVLIPESSNYNLKEFELLCGDDIPTGEFRSIGKFSAANIRLMRTPFQEFVFPATTARFFKFRVLSTYGGNSASLHQVRLFGRLAH